MMWVIAYVHHWDPEIIKNLYIEEMHFWIDGISWGNEQSKSK